MLVGPGRVFGGKYRLVEPLASGGMGAIWRARHADLDADVAVKLLSSAQAGSAVAAERFKREARAAARLKSVHIVQIHDYGVDAGHPYIVMELLDGEDLEQRMRREGPVSVARALEILRPLCKALAVAHEAGLVHRDIKPANVFLARVGQDEILKVLDFGIAKEGSRGAKESGKRGVFGSPMYMSPEQVGSGQVDHRSDLWSVAVLTFEMLTGQHPFRGSTMDDVFERIRKGEIRAPSELGVDHPGLDALFARSLERDPVGRCASAIELADAFEEVVAASPTPNVVQAHPADRDAPSAERPAEPPKARARESDTLTLAATHGDVAKRPAQPGGRAWVGLATAGLLAAFAVVAWRATREDPPALPLPAATAIAPATSEQTAPASVAQTDEAVVATAEPARPAPTTSSAATPRPAWPGPARATPTTRATGSASPASPSATAAPRFDPVFGVPITTP